MGAGTAASVAAIPESTPASDDRGRQETEEERADRNLAELLQELRVAGLGVQVLFGFLLSLPFSNGFKNLSHGQRNLYVATLLFATLATAFLTAPVAYHRLVFRRHQKLRLVRTANVMALAGLVAVACAISSAVLLVVGFVLSGIVVPLCIAGVVLLFLILWFVYPIIARGERIESAGGGRSAQGK